MAVDDWPFEHSPQTSVTVPWAPTSVSFADQQHLMPVGVSEALRCISKGTSDPFMW